MIDPNRLQDAVRGNIELLCRAFFPSGTRVGHEWKIGDVTGEKGESLGICLVGDKAGLWHDRATGDGGSFPNLLMQGRALTFPDAAGEIERCLGVCLQNGDGAHKSTNGHPPFDWTSLARLSPDLQGRLAKWRGYSPEFVQWLVENDLIRILTFHGAKHWAFPVSKGGIIRGCHHRPLPVEEGDKAQWGYLPTAKQAGPGTQPFVIGKLSAARQGHVFESTWDMLAACGRLGLHQAGGVALFCTRGASNGALVEQIPATVTDLYVWPQNDEPDPKTAKIPSEDWFNAVRSVLDRSFYRVQTPSEFGDLNDWVRAGATAKEIDRSIAEASPIEPPPNFRASSTSSTTSTAPGEELSEALLQQRYKAQDDDEFPDPMGEVAFYGPVGRIVQAVEPLTEASKEVLLLQLLVAFGCLIGRSPWVNAGGKHYTNEFLLIVGRTGRKGRKGTGNTIVDNICCQLDEDWYKLQMSGTQSGEGIIHQIRDEKWGPAKGKKGKNADPEAPRLELIDEGVTDKRKMVIEEEFSQVLAVAGRENSTVTETIRQAWDSKPRLQNSSKHNGAVVTNPHVSLVGHITPNEFRTKTAKTNDATNGTLNRFLFCASKRSKILPDAPYIDWTEPRFARLLKPLKDGYENLSLKTRAREMRITRDPEAQACWDRFYRKMAGQEYNGPLDEAMARAEQHVARLSEIFAIADNSYIVLRDHQLAAEAVWDYCERSARWAFGILTGDPRADKVIRALKRSPNGLTRTEISSQVFSRNMTKTDLEDVLTAVKKSGLADWTIECDSAGNPQVERWRAK